MIHLQLVFMAFLWGGTFIAGKLVAADIEPVTASCLRFGLASLMLLTTMLIIEKRLPKLSWKELLQIMVLGLTGIFTYNIFFFAGLKTMEAGRAGLVIALNPVLTFLLATLISRRVPHFFAVLGVLTSLVGAMIVISRGDLAGLLAGKIGQGEIYLFLCVCSWAMYAVIGKHTMRTLSPLVTTTYAVMAGTVFLIPFALHNGLMVNLSLVTQEHWMALVYLAFFGTLIGFLIFYHGVKEIGPENAAAFVNFVPLFAILLGMIFFNERLSSLIFIGGAMVLTGVYLTNRFAKQKSEKPLVPADEVA